MNRRLRIHKRQSNAKMNEDQVLAAYKLYQAGMSQRQIARLIWQRFGYASPNSAFRALQSAFRLAGYRRRSVSEAKRLPYLDKPHSNSPEWYRLRHYEKHGGIQPKCGVPSVKTGQPCGHHTMRGSKYCYHHDPTKAEARRDHRRRGEETKRKRVAA